VTVTGKASVKRIRTKEFLYFNTFCKQINNNKSKRFNDFLKVEWMRLTVGVGGGANKFLPSRQQFDERRRLLEATVNDAADDDDDDEDGEELVEHLMGLVGMRTKQTMVLAQ